MRSQFIVLALLGLAVCILLVLMALLVQTSGDQSATQTAQAARQEAIDDYMTMYAPGGPTGIPPFSATQTHLAPPPSALPKPGTQ